MYSLPQKPYINYTETIHNHSCSDKTCSTTHKSHIFIVNLCWFNDKPKKIIKISNGNECVGAGYPGGGGWHPFAVVFNGRQEDRKEHLYIIPIILNICIFPGFFLLFLLVFCIQSTPETGNRMIIHYLFSFFFILFLLHAL